MLEKLGLPPRPSARGREWVVDASHCQTCNSAFSLFNRKHHCRRCGGLFCGNCTQHRLYLRGQGDAPVRVCKPCKEIEEAARFEARHGHKAKSSKGSHNIYVSDVESDDILNELLEGPGPHSTEDFNHLKKPGSSSDLQSAEKHDVCNGSEPSFSPEDLRQQAQEAKRKYTSLKKEGKNEEALKAFKQSKELERKADALALSIRKNQKKTLLVGLKSKVGDARALTGESEEDAHNTNIKNTQSPIKRNKPSRPDTTEDELFDALKELGWNETSSEEPSKDIANTVSVNASSSGTANGPLRMQILGHKRLALSLKREGKREEAKEELKKAKLLERKLEELESIGVDEESDDELLMLMRTLNEEGNEESHFDGVSDMNVKEIFLDATGLPSMIDEEDDSQLEVTDHDMTDPDMIAALHEMGWTEQAVALQKFRNPTGLSDLSISNPEEILGPDKVQEEILAHKRKALALKRTGNVAEAKQELKRAKLLEAQLQELEKSQKDKNDEDTGAMDDSGFINDDPQLMLTLKALGFAEEPPAPPSVRMDPKEKRALQDEILSIKRAALAMKRQGKHVEAEKGLAQAKVLEEKMQNVSFPSENSNVGRAGSINIRGSSFEKLDLSIDGDDEDIIVEVTEEDAHDPELAGILKGLGWEDEFLSDENPGPEEEDQTSSLDVDIVPKPSVPRPLSPTSNKRKQSLQKELLGIKRKAFSLRKEGRGEEADSELRKCKVLEDELEGLTTGHPESTGGIYSNVHQSDDLHDEVTNEDMQDPSLLHALNEVGWEEDLKRGYQEGSSLNTGQKSYLHFSDGSNAENSETGISMQSAVVVDLLTGDPLASRSVHQAAVFDLDKETLKGISSFKRSHQEDSSLKAVHAGDLNAYASDGVRVRPTPSATKIPISNFHSVEYARQPPIDKKAVLPKHVPSIKVNNQDKTFPRCDPTVVFDTDDSLNIPNQHVSLLSDVNNLVPVETQQQNEGSSSSLNLQSKIQVAGNKELNPSMKNESHSSDAGDLNQLILAHKRKALAFKRQGDQEAAKHELRQAKLLERQLLPIPQETSDSTLNANIPPKSEHNLPSAPRRKDQTQEGSESTINAKLPLGMSGKSVASETPKAEQKQSSAPQAKDRIKVQQQLLAHKRKALALKREGKLEEAEAELEISNSLQKELEDMEVGNSQPRAMLMGDMSEIFDPQLMQALKSIGMDSNDVSHGGKPFQPKAQEQGKASVFNQTGKPTNNAENEGRIKALKLQALQLKRAGKQKEAYDVFKEAKRLEQSLP